ncbi:MAG: nucleotidyltransferase domain-containing protein [Saprospiraceae bacterium]|nr:nucleotidyltransferase domain-containing protein [Saprospiraceae bacterium]
MQASTMSIPIPERIKAQIRAIDSKAKVVLFGSRARGDARAESDWDFLVLVSKSLDEALERLIRNKLYEIELQTGEVIAAVIEEKDKWQDFEITAFYKNVEKEGIAID